MNIKYISNLINVNETGKNHVFIIDSKVKKLYEKLFQMIKDQTRIFIYNANEDTKNIDYLKRIYKFLHTNKVHRNSIICVIGGGVTTDIAAYAASTYKRGCRLVLIPTTLLGMVDAAIGGKTGFNFEHIKNGIGSFYPAEEVIISSDFLKTLPTKEYKDGITEIIKMSFLQQSNLQNLLTEDYNMEGVIKEAIRTKLELCEHDLYDKGSRRLLNLGHTFGHVLESISNYEISHGTAVAVGIRAAAIFSLKRGFINQEILEMIIKRLEKFALPVSFNSKYLPEIMRNGESILKQDKKADDKLNLVLFKGLQKLFIYRTDELNEIISLFQEVSDD